MSSLRTPEPHALASGFPGVFGLSNRGALVVGAGEGIGRATAELLAAAGARIAVLDRHEDRAEAVCRSIRDTGGEAHALCRDSSRVGEREAVVAAARRLLGEFDILVDITGSASWTPLLEMDEATWQRDRAVNLDQHLEVSRAFVRYRQALGRGGVICVVASISGVFGSAGHAAYGAAKAGLISFVRSAGEEWWPSGIRINAVVPGSVRTPRIEQTLMAARLEQGTDAVPSEMLARMAAPADVAGPVAFLVSDWARKLTGQTIVVDGGTTTRFPYALA